MRRTAGRRLFAARRSVPFLFQIFLHFQRGHAAGAGGGDGLAITAVLHVAAGEHAGHFREDILVRNQVAIRVGFELASEDLRVRECGRCPETWRWSGNSQLSPVFRLRRRRPVTSFLLTSRTSSTTVSVRNSILGFARARSSMIFEARNCSRRWISVTLLAKRVRNDRLFHGGVAAADHGDLLAGEEKAIAGGAGRNAVADQRMLVGQTEPARRSAAGDDQRAGQNGLFADAQLERLLAQIGFEVRPRGRCDTRRRSAPPACACSRSAPGPGCLRESRGNSPPAWSWRLAAGLMAFDDQRLEVGASAVEGGGVSRRIRSR